MQAYEYSHAAFAFSGNVYGATFFMATGFHGFHVLVGTIFLLVCLFRAYAGHFTPKQHLGFEFAAWYWHFVDVVWLFLFICIYVWGHGAAAMAPARTDRRSDVLKGAAARPPFFVSAHSRLRDWRRSAGWESELAVSPPIRRSRRTTLSPPGRGKAEHADDTTTLTQTALRGLACSCPRCGEGKLYAGFLNLRPTCEACGLDYAFIDAGDGPAIFIIMLAGAIVVARGADRRGQIPAAVLAACGAVAAADPRHHAAAVALDEIAADRAAIPSQGRRGPADRSRAEMSAVAAAAARRRRLRHLHAGDGRGAVVARGLAIAAPRREARADRGAERAACRRARCRCRAPAQWASLTPAQATNSAASRFTRDLCAAAGCDGLQLRLGGAQRCLRSRHLGVPAGAARRRRQRRRQCRLRAEHDAGPRAAGSRRRAAAHRRSPCS